MWFGKRVSRFDRVAQSIVDGLRDGSLVLDPPLAKDAPLGADPRLFTDRPDPTPTTLESTTACVRPGVYESFVPLQASMRPRRQTEEARHGSE